MYHFSKTSKFEFEFESCFFLKNRNNEIELILFYAKKKFYQVYLDCRVLFIVEIDEFFNIYKDLTDYCDDFDLFLYLKINAVHSKKFSIKYSLEDSQIEFTSKLHKFICHTKDDLFKDIHIFK